MKAVRDFSCFKALAVSLFGGVISNQAQSMEYIPSYYQQSVYDISVGAAVGSRTGDLSWNIANDSTGTLTPNILSELTYDDVEYSEFEAYADVRMRYGFLENTIFGFKFKTGTASRGDIKDSDYNGDNRTEEYSRSTSSAEGSTTRDIEVSLGYLFTLGNAFTLTPMAAYSLNQQNMEMTKGTQQVSDDSNLSVGEFKTNLNSSYDAQWNGFWIGGKLEWKATAHKISAQLQLHRSDYYAEANWNLRSDFAHPKSFAHWADGRGTSFSFGYQYSFSKRFTLSFKAFRESWQTDAGRDVVFFADGTRGATQLNEVTWDSSGYTLGLAFVN